LTDGGIALNFVQAMVSHAELRVFRPCQGQTPNKPEGPSANQRPCSHSDTATAKFVATKATLGECFRRAIASFFALFRGKPAAIASPMYDVVAIKLNPNRLPRWLDSLGDAVEHDDALDAYRRNCAARDELAPRVAAKEHEVSALRAKFNSNIANWAKNKDAIRDEIIAKSGKFRKNFEALREAQVKGDDSFVHTIVYGNQKAGGSGGHGIVGMIGLLPAEEKEASPLLVEWVRLTEMEGRGPYNVASDAVRSQLRIPLNAAEAELAELQRQLAAINAPISDFELSRMAFTGGKDFSYDMLAFPKYVDEVAALRDRFLGVCGSLVGFAATRFRARRLRRALKLIGDAFDARTADGTFDGQRIVTAMTSFDNIFRTTFGLPSATENPQIEIYRRRAAAIGPEFLAACENYNDFIANAGRDCMVTLGLMPE
jgi:hypothetical protein